MSRAHGSGRPNAWDSSFESRRQRIIVPRILLLQKLTNRKIVVTDDPVAGADQANVLYTDVWVSMGFEEESARRLLELEAFQINESLVARAASEALVLHCLPAYRGKEITAETLEKHARTIFDQAENRLHVQKAILSDVRK